MASSTGEVVGIKGSGYLRHATWLALLWGVAAHAAGGAKSDIYRFTAIPAWVEPAQLQLEQPGPPAVADDAGTLLYDRQIDITAEGSDDYTHIASRVANADAVEDQSHLTLNIDPSYETLQIHSLRVLRGSNAIDQRGKARITALPQETRLEQHIYNGAYSVDVLLSDVRPGDVVEYDYTIHVVERLIPGNYAERLSVGWSDPVRWQRVRLRYPADRPLRYRFSSGAIEPQSRHDGDHAELVFQWNKLAGIQADKDRPGWVQPWPILEVSDLPDWNAVERRLGPLYQLAPRPRPLLDAAVAEQAKASGNPAQKVMRALRWVQENIRYTSISIGPGSYTPTDPETVLERRFGDCKDKSLLLATLLRRLDIDARPALVHSRRGPILPQELPSPYVFDHAIVRVQLGAAVYWLDGTAYQQYLPLAKLEPANFAYALPIGGGVSALEQIPAPAADARSHEVRMDFDLSKGVHEPAVLDVVTDYRGAAADSMRDSLDQQSDAERQTNYLNYYARYYPGIKSAAPISIKDDTSADVLETHERYTLPQTFTAKEGSHGESFSVRADELYNYAGTLKSSLRTSPLEVSYPDHVRQTILVHMPDDWPATDMDTRIDNPAFRYRGSVSHSGHTVTLDYDYQALADHVEPAAMAQYQADRSKLNDDLDERFTYDPDKANAPSAPLAIAPAPLFAILGSLCLGIWLMLRYVYRYDPPARPAPMGAPEGIAGWLTLPALGCILNPLVQLYTVSQFVRFVDAEMWHVVPTIVTTAYASWAQTVMLIQLSLSGLLLPYSITVGVLFFRKRSSAPLLFGILLAAATMHNFFVSGTFALSGIKTADKVSDVLRDFGRETLTAILWSAYMLNSRRVKATFIKRLGPPPLPPPLPVPVVAATAAEDPGEPEGAAPSSRPALDPIQAQEE